MKPLSRLGRVALLACLPCLFAYSADFTALKPQGYANDFAGVMDAGSRAEIERYAGAVERATGAQMAFVILPSLEGEPVEDVANAIYRSWGVGKKGQNEGVLLLLAIRDRRTRLEVGYGLEPIITDGDAGEIIRAMRPYLREGQYGPAMLEAAHEIGNRIAQAKGVAIQEGAQRRRARPDSQPHVPIGMVIGGIILFALLSGLVGGRGSHRRNRGGFGGLLPGLIIGQMLGRGFGGRHGGGGFGGFDSGDSFGGFGGGDSGGGGASSDW